MSFTLFSSPSSAAAAAAAMSTASTTAQPPKRSPIRNAPSGPKCAEISGPSHLHSESKKVKKKLYVLRVEDKNSHMRMLYISSMEDLVANSMNIPEPSPVDANGNQLEDGKEMQPRLDLVLAPTNPKEDTFSYYDVFLKKYQELAVERKWKQPLLIALAYSLQIMDEGVIPVTSTHVLIDALVSPSGVIPISPAALEKM